MSEYERMLEQLQSPSTWCQAAQTLVKIGDRRALIPLVYAYETPVEVSKLCLLDAMDALDAQAEALRLYESGDAEQRRIALHLMELFPSSTFLNSLERAVSDPYPNARWQARRSLACQTQTSDWEALMIRLLESDDSEMRAQAIHSLSRRRTESARQALERRLSNESNDGLQEKIRNALEASSNS